MVRGEEGTRWGNNLRNGVPLDFKLYHCIQARMQKADWELAFRR
jgi:hypothetical protein